ncbi:MAG: hypothetical protein VYE22_02595 [Myxococcota bacterium]|nr:hypothetical protein [Myxococcota bacterium]
MSDLYSAKVTSLSAPFDLEEAVSRAAGWGSNARGARAILKRGSAPYAQADLRVVVDHPDADALDRLTPGLLHLLLVDLVPAVEAAAVDKLAEKYAKRRPTQLEKAGCVHHVTQADAKSMTLSVIGPADGMPQMDTPYVSTAWAPDRPHHDQLRPPADLRWFPAPGIAGGAKGSPKSVMPFVKVKKSLKVGGIAALGSSVFVVSHEGGHVAAISGKEAKKLGAPSRDDGKRAVRDLHAADDRLWIGWADGGWTAVDPSSGAREPGEGPELPPAPAGEAIEIAGLRLEPGRGEPLRLEPTPDPETLLFATDHAHYLLHTPTRALTPFAPVRHGARRWVEGKQSTLYVGVGQFLHAFSFAL